MKQDNIIEGSKSLTITNVNVHDSTQSWVESTNLLVLKTEEKNLFHKSKTGVFGVTVIPLIGCVVRLVNFRTRGGLLEHVFSLH
jgi:hypothetical protein